MPQCILARHPGAGRDPESEKRQWILAVASMTEVKLLINKI
jgi:hypothetical protein